MGRGTGSYIWKDVADHVDLMDKELYDNCQYGIEEAKDSLTTHTSALASMQSEVDALDTSITSCQGDIATHDEQISDIEDDIDEIYAIIGGGSSATMTATNTTGWISTSVGEGSDVNISFTWSSVEGTTPTGNGSFQLQVNNITKLTQTVAQGSISFNIKNYLSVGTNNLKVSISDVYGTKKIFKMVVNVVRLSVSTSFDFGQVRTGASTFNCVVKGSLSKTIHLQVDDVDIYTDTSSQSTKSYAIPLPMQTHGVHKITCFVSAVVNQTTIYSNIITNYTIFYSNTGTTVICIVPPASSTFDQYSVLSFDYQIYSDASLEFPVTVHVTVGSTSTQIVNETVDRTRHTVNYRLQNSGLNLFSVTTGTVTQSFQKTVTPKSLPISIETQGMIMNLTAKGKSQSVSPTTWTDSYGTTTTFTKTPIWDNDFQNGTRLILKENTAIINKKLFQTDFKDSGKTIEIDFSVEDGNSLSEVIVSCMNNNVGFYINNYSAHFYSQDLHREVYFNSGERICIAFVVDTKTTDKLVNTYINGVWSGVVQYADTDNFSQSSPQNITLSASNCKLKVYNIRAYNQPLDRETILNNYIASHENIDEYLDIYTRCDVMTNGEVDRTKLKVPYIILKTVNEGEVLPQYKKDYKYIEVTYIDNSDETRNWSTVGTQINVQGTSSAGYYRKNYTIKCKYNSDSHMYNYQGEEIQGWVLDTSKGIAEQTFVLKADVASSQMVHNICTQMFAQNNSPVKTPRQIENSGNTLQANIGFPVFVYWRNSEDTDELLGCYNLNTGKDSASHYDWNVRDIYFSKEDNTSLLCNERTNVLPANWYEYMEESNPVSTRDPELASDYPEYQTYLNWICSCDPEKATGVAIPPVTYEGVLYTNDTIAYRNARFRATASQYLMLQNQFYYYCVIESVLGVDSLVKNDMLSYFVTTT